MPSRRTASERALGALRRLDDRLGGYGPGEWTFDGEPLQDGPLTDLLLSLHDDLIHLGDEGDDRVPV